MKRNEGKRELAKQNQHEHLDQILLDAVVEALSKKMVAVYGWQIQEAGEPGKGAKFTISIPRINKNGKENFQIAAKHDPKPTLEHNTQFVHISSHAVPILFEKGGDDIVEQRVNR